MWITIKKIEVTKGNNQGAIIGIFFRSGSIVVVKAKSLRERRGDRLS